MTHADAAPTSPGESARLTFTVGSGDTAAALGSGDLPVLGTPRLLAWCEAATCSAVAGRLTAAQSSVGTRASVAHVAASPVGAEVAVSARLVHSDGRLLRFEVVAEHVADGKVVGHGEVTRVVVERDRFLARVTP